MTPARTARCGAVTAFVGAVVSGPLALWVVQVTHPQPAWRGADAFAAAYHPVQAAPYFAGFFLVGGLVVLVSGLHALAPPALGARTAAAVAFAGAFAAMIVVNYALQTTVVPALVQAGDPASRSLAAAITMANPRGIGWALEMWGYGVLGVATWLCAPVFAGAGPARWTRAAFVANGPVSVVGGVVTAVSPGWVMTTTGLVSFACWNVLVMAMTGLAAAWLGRQDESTHEVRR